MNTFTQLNLNPNIYKALTACGYSKPTPIQARSIPDILNGKDLVASAQTGTGKTAAFVLPALHHLSVQHTSKKTRILILTPTRELSSQITKAAMNYGKFLQFKIVSLVGGMPYHHQIKDLARGADIIVATPGRLLDHIQSKRVDLSNIEMLVLDEADRMLDMGFIDDVQRISQLTPSSRQTLLFSATLDKQLMHVVRHLLRNPVRIDLSNEKTTIPQITQELYKVNNAQHKIRLLKHFLDGSNIFKAIIFSATKTNADKLAHQLRDQGYSAAALHGDLRQNVRNRTIEQLRRGKIQFLVATDVAARGIDVRDISHVINYDLPKFCEDYVHRIGRTGRAGKSGIAISFVLPADTRNLQRIERYIGQRLKFVKDIDCKDLPTLSRHEMPDRSRWDDSGHNDDDRPRRSKSTNSHGERRRWNDSGSNNGDKPRRSHSTNSNGDRHRWNDSGSSNGDRPRRSNHSTNSNDDRHRWNDSGSSNGDRPRRSNHSANSNGDRPRWNDSTNTNDGHKNNRRKKKFASEKNREETRKPNFSQQKHDKPFVKKSRVRKKKK